MNLRKFTSGVVPSGRVQEPGFPAHKQGKPVAIGEALTLQIGRQGGDLLLVHPAAAIPAAAETLPRGAVFRIQAGDLSQVGNRLGLQSLQFAPESELPVSRGRLWDVSPSRLVLGEQRRALIVGLLAAGGLIRLQPLAADLDLAQQSSGRGTGGVRPNGEFEETLALAVLSFCLALDCLPDQSFGLESGEDASSPRQTTR